MGNRGFEYWFPRPVREGACSYVLCPALSCVNSRSYAHFHVQNTRRMNTDARILPLGPKGDSPNPLVILGGGREHETGRFEYYQADDSGIDAKVGRALREFLPAVFPGKFVESESGEGEEVEMEWVSAVSFVLFCFCGVLWAREGEGRRRRRRVVC